KVEITTLSRPREGLQKVKDALKLDPGRTQTYESLSDAYASLDAREEAITELIALLTSLPTACRDASHAAAIAALIGRNAGALRRPLQAEAAEEFVAYLGQTIQSVAAPRTRKRGPVQPLANTLPRQELVTELLPEQARGPLVALAAALGEVVPKISRLDPQLVAAANRDRWTSRPTP